MAIVRNIPTSENIAYFREEMASHSDDQLELQAAKDPNTAWGIAAKLMLSERRAKAERERHAELVKEISTPHWSVVPSFKLLVGSIVISVVALAVSIAGLPQAQSLFQKSASSPGPAASGQPTQAGSPAKSSSTPQKQEHSAQPLPAASSSRK